MLMPTSGRPSMASPASLSTAARDEGRGGDQLLFGEGAEDLFLNHLDQEDFSALAAACSPTATPTNSYSASVWASSEALPSQAAAAPLPFVGSGGAIGAVGAVGMPDPRRVSGPFSPSARLPPGSLHRSFLHHPAGGGGVGGVNGGVGRLTSPAGAAMGGGAGARLTSVSGYQATTPVSGFHARAAGHHGHGGVAQTSEADLVPTLLAVGTGRGSGAVVGASTHAFMCGTRGSGLSDVVTMLTAELDRHGRKPEIDHVVSGERAVDRVKALKRCGLWYWVIVLEVEGSLAAAIVTAREIRCDVTRSATAVPESGSPLVSVARLSSGRFFVNLLPVQSTVSLMAPPPPPGTAGCRSTGYANGRQRDYRNHRSLRTVCGRLLISAETPIPVRKVNKIICLCIITHTPARRLRYVQC